MDRPNFYLLLDLDPAVSDPAVIDAALNRKRAEWSRARTAPTRGREAQQNLELVRVIQEELRDPVKRDLQAQECRRLLQQRQREAARELDQDIALLAVRGYLLAEELAHLVRRYAPQLPEPEIRRRIAVPIREGGPTRPTLPPALDGALAREIANRLQLVGKKDLYEFLDCPPDAPLARLQESASRQYAAAQANNNKTAVVTAQAELAGHGQAIFKNEVERQKYDATRARQPLEELNPRIETAGVTGTIPAEVVEHLLQAAQQKGVARDLATAYLLDLAARRKWSVSLPQASAAVRLCRCPCGVFNPEGAAACAACGGPLTVECPRCRTRHPAENRACPQCGLSAAAAGQVRRLVHEGDLALARGEHREAARLLREALVHWPGHPEAESRLQQAARRAEEEERAYQAVQTAVTAHRFQEAQGLFTSWKRLAPGHPEAGPLGQQIDQAIEAARRHLARARTLEQAGKSDDAADAYRQAVAACQDLAEARDGLARCPPPPPSGLRARATPAGVLLSWQPSPSRRPVVYLLLRRDQANGIGAEAARTAALTWSDTGRTPGSGYWYELLAVTEDGTASAAVRAGPVLAVGEVAGFKAEPSDRQVVLAWQAPAGARRVEVYRAAGRVPASPAEAGRAAPGGALLPVSTSGRLRDAGLDNETTYGYRACCVFVGPDGREVVTPGVSLTATPCTAPPPVTAVTAAAVREGLSVSWYNPGRAVVHVVRATRAPDLAPGAVLACGDLDELGTRLPGATITQVIDPAPRVEEPCYLVFAVNRFLASYSGQAQYVELDGLTARVEERGLVLSWSWPPGCVAVEVRHGDRSLGAGGRPIPRGSGPLGTLTLNLAALPAGVQTFHARCVLADADRACVAGPGAKAVVRIQHPRAIRWRWERRGLLRKTVAVVVQTDHDLSDLTWLRLVGKVNEVPRSAEDGRRLAEWRPGEANGDGVVRLAVTPWPGARGEVFCRLFCDPPDALTILQLPTRHAVL